MIRSGSVLHKQVSLKSIMDQIPTSSCGDGNTCGAHLEVCEIGSCILLSSDVCRKWKDIGFELGFEKERLEGIERKCGNKPTDCFRAMLAEWWPRNDDGACGCDSCCWCSQMLTLVEALSKPHVGLLHIANEIRKEVCGYTCDHPDAGHSSVSSFADKDKMTVKGGASHKAVHQMSHANNSWKTSNLSSAQGLHVPDESRVQDFRTESSLAEKTCELEHEFIQIIFKTLTCLKKSKVPIQEICFCLAEFEDTDRFMKANTLDDVFVLLGSCISWINYPLLEMIIRNFATEEVQQTMHRYIGGLKGSLEERKVSELPPDIYKNASGKHSNPSIVENNKKKLGVKIDYVWEKFLVKDIQTMRERIASILGIEERSLFLLSVTEGCVYLEFLVPEFVSEEILCLEITPDMHSEFERARVIEVVCSTVLVYTNKIQYHVETYMYSSTEWLFNELVEVT